MKFSATLQCVSQGIPSRGESPKPSNIRDHPPPDGDSVQGTSGVLGLLALTRGSGLSVRNPQALPAEPPPSQGSLVTEKSLWDLWLPHAPVLPGPSVQREKGSHSMQESFLPAGNPRAFEISFETLHKNAGFRIRVHQRPKGALLPSKNGN